jgi:hypothetical protein
VHLKQVKTIRRLCRFSTKEMCALLLKESSLVCFFAHFILSNKEKEFKNCKIWSKLQAIFLFFGGYSFYS